MRAIDWPTVAVFVFERNGVRYPGTILVNDEGVYGYSIDGRPYSWGTHRDPSASLRKLDTLVRRIGGRFYSDDGAVLRDVEFAVDLLKTQPLPTPNGEY